MTTIPVLMAVLAFTGFQDPPAQEVDGGGRERRVIRRTGGGEGGQTQDPQRQAEQRAQWLKDQVGLTDEQLQKAVEIYKQSTEAQQKLETDRQAKLRDMLTDDQKKKYDDMIANMNRPRSPLSGLERMMDGWADTLKKELSLDDPTLEKAKAHIDEFRKKIQERTEKMRAEGFQGMTWQEEMQKFQDGAKEVGEKIKGHLSPEQKEKFDKLVERMNPGRGGFSFGPGDRRGPPSVEDRVNRAMETLKISDSTEQTAVKSAVQKVIEAETAIGEYDREARTKIEELHRDSSLSDEAVNTKLNEVKSGRLERDKAYKAAQAALREIVTARQELELIRLRLLR